MFSRIKCFSDGSFHFPTIITTITVTNDKLQYDHKCVADYCTLNKFRRFTRVKERFETLICIHVINVTVFHKTISHLQFQYFVNKIQKGWKSLPLVAW